MKNHRYTVELRVYGASLDPAAVTRETGLAPCQTRLPGEQAHGRTYEKGLWAYDAGHPDDWDSLEDGLAFVLDSVEAKTDLFAKYATTHGLIWWCGHFQSSFDGGPILSAKIMERLGRFGCELYLDNYFSRPEEPTVH